MGGLLEAHGEAHGEAQGRLMARLKEGPAYSEAQGRLMARLKEISLIANIMARLMEFMANLLRRPPPLPLPRTSLDAHLLCCSKQDYFFKEYFFEY